MPDAFVPDDGAIGQLWSKSSKMVGGEMSALSAFHGFIRVRF